MPSSHTRRLVPCLVAVLATGLVAACERPGERISEQTRAILSIDGRDVELRSRFDPFQRAYYTDVLPVLGPDAAVTEDEAVRIVTETWGPELCDGAPMEVSKPWGIVTTPVALTPYETRGGWQVVATCS